MAGRPRKTGLSYHSSDVDFYEDFKIIDLLDKYGPVGTTIYDVVLKMIYRRGYYIEIPMNQLALTVQKTIGSKWIRNKDLVLQVVQYCADIGLFDKDLSLQSVLTSAGIQKRYSLATVRSKAQIEKYRLIEKESSKPLFNAPQNSIFATEMPINATEIPITEDKMTGKESKGNNIYDIAFPPDVEKAFQFYLFIRNSKYGEIPIEQINALREELQSLSKDQEEQIAIIKKASTSGWKSFYKVKKEKPKEQKKPVKKNSFNNFKGREYDMNKLERGLLGMSTDKERSLGEEDESNIRS